MRPLARQPPGCAGDTAETAWWWWGGTCPQGDGRQQGSTQLWESGSPQWEAADQPGGESGRASRGRHMRKMRP